MTPAGRAYAPTSGGAPVIVGAGLAGLVTALRMAPLRCVVLTAGPLGHGVASAWAQGGLAAAVGPADSPALHAADTQAVGGGLCDPVVVERVTGAAPAAVDWLLGLGVRFDRRADGSLSLGMEGAHSRHRIVHAGGDRSGAEILRAVTERVRATPSVGLVEHARASRILIDEDGAVGGLLVVVDGHPQVLTTRQVVLATGGASALWRHTTNPPGAHGAGLALAARVGARLRDLEMVQFHPTAMDVGLDPMPLVSEAVRGAGAVLVDEHGRRLLEDDLAARDVVARAVHARQRAGGRVYLDARAALGERFADAFPSVHRACVAAGLDPARHLLPVRPAAHYHCGGIEVDGTGRTSVPGLWAVGEVASTGLHGANRLASNSLLEAVVCGGWVGADVAAQTSQAAPASSPRSRPGGHGPGRAAHGTGDLPSLERAPADPARLATVRDLVSRSAGVSRDGATLHRAVSLLRSLVAADGGPDHTDDATLTALLVCHAALGRQESRGGHHRSDASGTRAPARHSTTVLGGALGAAPADPAPDLDPVLTGGAP